MNHLYVVSENAPLLPKKPAEMQAFSAYTWRIIMIPGSRKALLILHYQYCVLEALFVHQSNHAPHCFSVGKQW